MTALVAFSCVAVACALLSMVVVTRRWAFIGEGIGHSGFGGAGTAWLLMTLFPALGQSMALTNALVVLFALAAALGMGMLSRRGQISADVAVGIFLVATVAWGFLGQHVYRIHHNNSEPAGFNTLFFGQPQGVSIEYAMAAISIMLGVIVTLVALRKEVLAYCIDPQLAQVSGVAVGFVHYLLITMVAITTIIGMQVVGTLLITALLVLPGATAQRLSKRLGVFAAICVAVGLCGAVVGWAVHERWRVVPVGPAIVLVMFALFVLGTIASKVRRA
jgi:ABC-type Mn2+/Zn2+ transport system permease subunit